MTTAPAPQLKLPVFPYAVTGYRFGQRVRSRVILWARHLGDDVLLPPGTAVKAIGEGRVVWAEMRKGEATRRNWGGIVVIEHTHKKTNNLFYSLYGHMKNVQATGGSFVQAGQTLGEIAEGSTPENGWWLKPHLHFAIYIGPWTDNVLPGYKRFFDDRTRFSWWRDPKPFIDEYNKAEG